MNQIEDSESKWVNSDDINMELIHLGLEAFRQTKRNQKRNLVKLDFKISQREMQKTKMFWLAFSFQFQNTKE